MVDFDMAGKAPQLPSNVDLLIGTFQDTVPEFAKSVPDVALLHIDCDLYDSTKIVFDELGSSLKKGCIIVFDEYFNYPGFRSHEHRAFAEYMATSARKFEWFSYCGERAACRLC